MPSAVDLFKANPKTQSLFYAIWNRIRGLYEGADIDVFGDLVRLRENGRTFCWIWAPKEGSGEYTDGSIIVSFSLETGLVPPKNSRASQVSIGRWIYHVCISSEDDISGTVLSMIDKARCSKLCGKVRGREAQTA